MLHLLEQLPVELEPELFATVGEQAEVDGQCPEEVADRARRGAPSWKTTTRRIVEPIVMRTFATLATTYEVYCCSTRKSEVSCP